jgi:DNA-directed RNA polymerase subunit RPC12/RpoP
MTQKQYICANCRKTFIEGWSDEEAAQEARILFGTEIPIEERSVICDDCYKKFLLWLKKQPPGWTP